MNKKCRLFLWIGFTFFAFSVIAILLNIIATYHKIQTDFPHDNMRVMNEFGFVLVVVTFIIIPFFAVQLSFIRSVYKILKCEPKGYVKICYIVSSVLAFLAVVFQCLVSVGLINFENVETGQNFTAYILFFTELPAFIVSFALGSIHEKHNN